MKNIGFTPTFKNAIQAQALAAPKADQVFHLLLWGCPDWLGCAAPLVSQLDFHPGHASLIAQERTVTGIIPKNEIQMANLPQFTGRKLFGKTSPDRFGYGFDLSKQFPLQHLAAS